MCVDLKGWPRHRLVPHTSNIGTLGRRPGGVAFNIAANLARLGCHPTFLSAVGDDPDGDYLLGQCALPGIDTGRVRRVAGASTPVYLAVLDESGDLAVAVAAMDLCDVMTPELLGIDDALGEHPPLVLADANLPPATLDHLARSCRQHDVPLWVEPTTADKCQRLRSCLDSITFLSPNHEELEVLVGRPLPADADLHEGARCLVAQGVAHVFVTLGPQGVLWVSREGARWHATASVPVRDVTGAGDAFVAGAAWAIAQGLPMQEAVDCGIASSLLAIQVVDSVPPALGPALVHATRQRFLGGPPPSAEPRPGRGLPAGPTDEGSPHA